MLKIKRSQIDKVDKKHKNFIFFALLFNIIKKNFKLIIRSKSSSLVVLLGPLIIIALVGTAYNTSNIYDIRIGAYSESYSELADSLLDALGGQQFSVVKFDNEEQCITSIKSSEVHVCVIIPKDLTIDTSEAINFHVDQSRVNLVWIVIDALSSKVKSKSSELSLQLTSAMLNTLGNAQVQISEKEKILETLISSNEGSLTKVTEVSTSLNNINTDLVSAIDLGKISQKLDEVISVNNLSSSMFDPVKATITNIKNNTEQLGTSLTSLKADVGGKIEEVKGSLDTNKNNINEIKSSLSGLKTNIESVTGTSAENVVTPIKTQITPIVAEKTHLNFLFPTLVILVVMLIGLLLSSGLVVKEKTSSAFFRNYITPTNDGIFILGHFLTNFIILTIQLVVVLGVASIFFKGALSSVILLSAIVLLFIISVFILLGMAIGYLFKTEETSVLATISVASLLLFFSSTILPLETLPSYLKQIALYNPFVISEDILKKVMLFKVEFVSILDPLLILVTYIILLLIIVYGVERYSKLNVE